MMFVGSVGMAVSCWFVVVLLWFDDCVEDTGALLVVVVCDCWDEFCDRGWRAWMSEACFSVAISLRRLLI